MSRTNIDIDDELLRMTMSLYNLRTKREAVNYALHRLVGDPTCGACSTASSL